MPKRLRIGITVIILTLLALCTYYYFHYYLAPAASGLEASGTIEATTVELRARTYGTVHTFNASSGDYVEQNQLVAALTRNDLLAQKERDLKAVEAAQAHWQDLIDGSQREDIAAAAASVDTVAANLEKATADLKRIEELYTSGAASQQQLESAALNKKGLENQLVAAQSRLDQLNNGARPQQIAMAAAEVQRAEAVLKATEALVQDLQVASPLNGTLISKNFEAGEFVTAGASLATVADLSSLWMKVYVPADDLSRITLGQPVTVSVSGSGATFAGSIIEIASQGEFTPKTILTKKERTNIMFAVKISVDDNSGILKPGMPADVVFVDEGSSS